MHRRLAEVIAEPEPAARHLAWLPPSVTRLRWRPSMSRGDGEQARSAAAAAELVELAVGLGGDTPQRRSARRAIISDAGILTCRAVLEKTVNALNPGRCWRRRHACWPSCD